MIDNINLKNNNKKNDYEMIKKKEINKLLILAKEQGNGVIKKQNETSNTNFTTNQIKYPPIKLSKFEKNCFQKAKERQFNRLNNGTEQIAAGKIFNGIAFVADPCEIIFTDFEIGKKYKKNIFFTNTSYSFNSFKLVEMSEDIVEYFTISYERMGRMSAGVSVNIEIVFSPKRNIDIHSGKILKFKRVVSCCLNLINNLLCSICFYFFNLNFPLDVISFYDILPYTYVILFI